MLENTTRWIMEAEFTAVRNWFARNWPFWPGPDSWIVAMSVTRIGEANPEKVTLKILRGYRGLLGKLRYACAFAGSVPHPGADNQGRWNNWPELIRLFEGDAPELIGAIAPFVREPLDEIAEIITSSMGF